MICITNAALLTPSGVMPDASLLASQGVIAALGELDPPRAARRLDAGGLLLAPGLIDLQINGAFGCDFTTQPQSIWEVGARLPRFGVTAFLPTIVTSPLETVLAARQVLRQGPPAGYRGALPFGLHLEGPFLSPEKPGAHNPAHLRLPDPGLTSSWCPQGLVRLVTLAPELPGALELVRRLIGCGIVVFAGHSTASYEQALLALDAGLRGGTHLFNAMPPLDHRRPGLVGALLNDPRACFSLIADGLHVHPALVELAWRAAGPQRVFLVSDAMAALGNPPGRYTLADREVIVDRQAARLPGGRLAGSLLGLDQAVRNLLAFTGCPPAQALQAASLTPARVLDMERTRGRLIPGSRADLVLLTPELQVAACLVAGELVYSALD